MSDKFKVESIKIDDEFIDSILLPQEVEEGYARILRQSSRKKLSYDKIHKLFYENMGRHIMSTLTVTPELFSQLKIYRAFSKSDIESRDTTSPSSFSAPPTESTKMGRANIAKHPVFYGGDSEITALKETNLFIKGKEFYLSCWKPRKLPHKILIRLILFNNMHIDNPWRVLLNHNFLDEEFKNEIPNEKLEGLKRLNDKICEMFVAQSKHYQITSFIGNEQLYSNNNTKTKMLMPLFVYPSVKNKLSSANFAIRPEFVQSYLYVNEVIHGKIKSTKDGQTRYDVIKIGKLEDGKIKYYKIIEDEINSKVRVDYMICSCGLKVDGDKYKLGHLSYKGKPISVIHLYSEAQRIGAVNYLDDISYLDDKRNVKSFNIVNFKTNFIPNVEYIDTNGNHKGISLIGRKNFATKWEPI